MTNPTTKIEKLFMYYDDIKDDLVPSEEFDRNETLELLRLYR